jgi:hypothetical protein
MTTNPWPTYNCKTYDVTHVSFKAPPLQNFEVSITREIIVRKMAHVLLFHSSLLPEKHSTYRKQFWNLPSNSALIVNYLCQKCVGSLVYRCKYTHTHTHTLTYKLRKYINTYTYIYVNTYRRTYTYTYTNTNTNTHTHTHTHKHTHTHTNTL